MSKQLKRFNGIFISVHAGVVVCLYNHIWFITLTEKHNYTKLLKFISYMKK